MWRQTTRVEVASQARAETQSSRCKACGKPIVWVLLPADEARGSARKVRLDPDPHPWGQYIRGNDPRTARRVKVGAEYPDSIQRRRFRDHATTCKIGTTSTWTLQAALRNQDPPKKGDISHRIRQLRLELERSGHP